MRSIIKGRPSVVIWRDGVEKTWCSGATPWGWWKETGASKKVHQQQRVSKQCIVHPDVMLQTLHKNHTALMLICVDCFQTKENMASQYGRSLVLERNLCINSAPVASIKTPEHCGILHQKSLSLLDAVSRLF